MEEHDKVVSNTEKVQQEHLQKFTAFQRWNFQSCPF